MLESIIGALVVLVIVWIASQPRPRALLKRLTSRAEPLLGGSNEAEALLTTSADWEKEFTEFREAAAFVWNTLVRKFEAAGFYGEGSRRDGLRHIVAVAPWPDEETELQEGAEFAKGVLGDFADQVYQASGEAVFALTDDFHRFDTARRRVTAMLKHWSTRIDDTGFDQWLREELAWPRLAPGSPPPHHRNTVKLAWYLELALAQTIGNASARLDCLAVLRDTLDAPAHIGVTVNREGYLEVISPPDRMDG